MLPVAENPRLVGLKDFGPPQSDGGSDDWDEKKVSLFDDPQPEPRPTYWVVEEKQGLLSYRQQKTWRSSLVSGAMRKCGPWCVPVKEHLLAYEPEGGLLKKLKAAQGRGPLTRA